VSVFYKYGFERTSVLGNLHDVRGHWVSRDEWGVENRSGISVADKVAFLFGEFRGGRKRASETKPTNCPECGAAVYFYRNECGGAVWFDALGWPWPKHPCMDREDSSCGFGYFNKQEAAKREKARLERLAKQEAELRANKKEARRNKVKLWQVCGPVRFYRLGYKHFWHPEYYIPKEFHQTPRTSLLRAAKRVGDALRVLPEQSLTTKYEISRPAKLYGPRKMKMVFDYFEDQGQSAYSFVMPGGEVQISIPLRLIRSFKVGEEYYICAVSEIFPWVGIWLHSPVGLAHRRERHALLEWTESEAQEKLLSFMSFSQSKLHWRNVSISGIFDARRMNRG